MAGRGRPKKASANHALAGTFRADRHGQNGPAADGEPYQIIELDGAADLLWTKLVPKLVAMGVAKEVDSFALCTMCRLAARLHDVLGDEDIDEYKRSGAASAILKQLNTYVEKFGLTPVDRQKMNLGREKEDNPFAAFLMGLHGSDQTEKPDQQGASRGVHRRSTPRKNSRRKTT